ncbi:MAG: hypothetical protein WCL00_10950 [Bacteroidota bacterium]
MKQIKSLEKVIDLLSSSTVVHVLAFISFTVAMSLILASQNFFFQSIIENGISKKDIVAQKTITVVDAKRSEQHNREIAQTNLKE